MKYILSLGPKFNLDRRQVPYHEIISSVELGICSMVESEKTLVRNEVCNILNNNKIHANQHSCKDFKEKILRGRLKETKEFLKSNPELLVTKADKGNITVVITKEYYSKKMKDLFLDQGTYVYK